MTLIAQGNLIRITKPNGTEIFNSNNKLVHKKFTATGSASVGEGYGHQYGVTLNTTFNTDKDVALIFVTFTAGNGSVTSQVIGSTVQLNFGMLMHFTHATTEALITNYDLLSSGVGLTNNNNPVLGFSATGWKAVSAGGNCHPNIKYLHSYRQAATYASFNWRFVLLTYQ
jgi:hypothetical protein